MILPPNNDVWEATRHLLTKKEARELNAAIKHRGNLPNPLPRPADARDEQINYQQRRSESPRREGNR